MVVQTTEPPMPNWQEIGRLAEVIGLPNNKYRSPQSDSVLDKSSAIQLFQRFFRDLLVNSEQISQSLNPAQLLTEKLLGTFSDLFPQFPQQIGRLADGLSVVRYVSNPSDRLKSTATQDLERLSLSSIAKVIEEIATDSVSRGSQIYKLRKDKSESEGAQALIINSLRLSALRGLSETLIYSGDIGLEFTPALLSQFNNEPYHALSALYSLGQLNVSKNANDISNFKVSSISSGKTELAEMLNERFRQLKPQVLTLLDQVLTKIAFEALKYEINNSTDPQLALRLQLLSYDAIRCLDFADSKILPITLGPIRERVVSAISDRVLGDTLRLTLSAWGVSAPEREDGRAVDFIDAILEIRQQLNS
jgi:hypothetical protein